MRAAWRVAWLVLFALAAATARAQTATVQEIGGKQVPLAEGPWIAAGNAAGRLQPAVKLSGYGMIRNQVFLRPAADGHGVAAMAEINANELATEDGWGVAADCEPAAGAESAILVRSGWDAACWFVAPRQWDWTVDMPPSWRQARAAAGQRGLALPERTVTVGLRVASRTDVIDLRFHLAAASDIAQREVLAEWAAASLGLLEAGLTHGLPEGRGLPGFDLEPAALARASITQDRIARLEALVAQGALSAEAAHAQEEAIRAAAEREMPRAYDPSTVEGLRWFSMQTGLAVTDAGLTYVWTERSVQAAALTALQTGLRSARTYITSVIWNEVSSGTTRLDAARVVDFAYGGHRPAGGSAAKSAP